MPTTRLISAVALGIAFCLSASAHAPAPFPRKERAGSLPVGRWVVRFDNGVVQTCQVSKDGSAHVVEPHRNSPGKATVKGSAIVIVSDDDRTERWRRVEGRLVVEHWCP